MKMLFNMSKLQTHYHFKFDLKNMDQIQEASG